jgi:succinate-semialdehyde dehydrogenase/glutarate-semialdehyde dehydrogenase
MEQYSPSDQQSINPATGESLERFALQSESALDQALERSTQAQRTWSQVRLVERAAVLFRIAAALLERKQQLALDITLEMGKPLAESEAEVEKCAWNCRYVAEMGEAWLADEMVPTNATESYISYLPLGPILAVMPWNFPLWQVFRFVAPALMAGNTVLLKHAPNVQRCARNIAELIAECAETPGLLENLIIPVEWVSRIIADPRLSAVTLTGSPRAGAAVATQAGAALKKCVLELGGSDAFVVFADANLEGAVEAAVRGRFSNCGQICLAPKRFILHRAIAEDFESRFVDRTAQLQIGDPLDRSTQLGPMARPDLLEELDLQVQSTVESGGRLLMGGRRRSGAGNYYLPTILTDIVPSMTVAREETFGPVAAIMRAEDEDHALTLVHASDYGLSCNIWTKDLTLARQFARRVQAGGVFINGVSASDPRLPIGGVKKSGFGRELSAVGIREFVNTQTVWVGPAQSETKPEHSVVATEK